MYKGETACRRKIIYVLLVNDTLLVNESPPTTENGALYQSIVGNTYRYSADNTIPLSTFYFTYRKACITRKKRDRVPG